MRSFAWQSKKQSFLVLDMPPNDGGLELTRAAIEGGARGENHLDASRQDIEFERFTRVRARPPAGAELEAPPPFLHADAGPACSRRFTCSTEKPSLRPGRGVLPRMAGVARSAGGALHRRERFLQDKPGDICEKDAPSFAKTSSRKISPPARKLIAYQNAWQLLTNRRRQP